jgi:hypothetical protein
VSYGRLRKVPFPKLGCLRPCDRLVTGPALRLVTSPALRLVTGPCDQNQEFRHSATTFSHNSGCGLWLWPLAGACWLCPLACGCGLWLRPWPVAMAVACGCGRGCGLWRVAVACGRGLWLSLRLLSRSLFPAHYSVGNGHPSLAKHLLLLLAWCLVQHIIMYQAGPVFIDSCFAYVKQQLLLEILTPLMQNTYFSMATAPGAAPGCAPSY